MTCCVTPIVYVLYTKVDAHYDKVTMVVAQAKSELITLSTCHGDVAFSPYFATNFSAMILLVGRQEGHPACKKTEQWGAGMVICLKRGAVLHMAQLMPLPLIVSCFSKIQIGFTFLVPAHPGSPGQRAVKQVCVF